MRFSGARIPGVWLVESEPVADERGFFARVWDADEFAARGLTPPLVQCSRSYNRRCGTLRGLHFQQAPCEETKLVFCTRGAVYDVVLDLRRDSPMFRQWMAVELTAADGRMLYIPEGCAHGFQTLADDSEMLYFISPAYSPAHGAGVRWNDPAFGIDWPRADQRIMSDRDRAFPDFEP
jgi:dTDP-4-dehydrorhamnose 3,5-epimerase